MKMPPCFWRGNMNEQCGYYIAQISSRGSTQQRSGAASSCFIVPSIVVRARNALLVHFLVFQLAHELAPSHIADTLGQAVVLEHVLDRQALDAHHLVFADNTRR